MNTFDKIQDIFYSGSHAFRGDKDSISEIAFLIDNNYLSVSPIIISSKEEYDILLNNPHKLSFLYEAAGGGGTHIALKILAKEYLKIDRGHESVFEHPFCGYYPDVLSVNESIVIECGHTGNPEKILTYFRQGNIKECIQIPYPSSQETEIIGHSFIAKDKTAEFLIFLEKEKLAKTKNLFFHR